MLATPLTPVDVTVPQTARDVVEAFLARLAVFDLDRAVELCAEDITYVNVGLPSIHGRAGVKRALGLMARFGTGFEAYLHAVAADGDTVLTERTDVLVFGRVRQQFWVTGRFDVVDGQIALWRDSFDYVDLALALGRGLVGAVIPALAPKPPTTSDTPPGRH